MRSAGASVVLDELQGTKLEFVLQGDEIESGTNAVQIERGALRGEVHADARGENIVITGWAGDVRARRAVDSLVLFVDGRSVATWPPSFTGKRIFRRYAVPLNGFRYELPRSALPDSGQARRVRVFAIRDNVATELGYTGPYLTAGRG